jgi:hypothetical protein
MIHSRVPLAGRFPEQSGTIDVVISPGRWDLGRVYPASAYDTALRVKYRQEVQLHGRLGFGFVPSFIDIHGGVVNPTIPLFWLLRE